MKILILKPSSLGDVVQALPVLRLLKTHLPKSKVYWWLGADFVPLLENDPDLAGIFPFERRRWASPLNWIEVLRGVRQMREARFDWVIDLQGLARSGAFAWLAAGGYTIGVDDPREGAGGFYDVVVPRPSMETHAVDWYLEVLRVLKVPVHRDFIWLPECPAVAAEVRRKWQTDAGEWIIINPGARWLNKRWPAEHFAELVRTLATWRSELRFAILGGREDVPLGATIRQAAPDRCLDLTGRTSLPEMVEWIRLSRLMVTNDTGPMHVAAALGKPVVALFGPTNPHRTGPFRQIDRAMRIALPCAPCLKPHCSYPLPMECLRAIQPSQAADLAQRRLEAEVR